MATGLLRIPLKPTQFMLRTLFILSILVPGFYLSLRSRYFALLMYLWFALFRPQDWLWIDITNLRLSLVLGFILIVPALPAGLFPNITNPLSVGMLSFLFCSLVTQSVAVAPAIGWTWIDFMTRLLLSCMMIMTLAKTPQRLAGVVAVIGGSLAFHASKAGLAFMLGGGRFADGLAGAFIDNNGYALGTVMVMPLVVAAAQNVDLIYDGRWRKWIQRGAFLAVPFCMLAVIGTYSRGGFVALAAISLCFVLLQRRPAFAVSGLVAAVVVVLLLVPIPQAYLDRLQTIQTYKETGEESALGRTHFWAVALRMVEANPIGIGLRQYEQAYDRYDFSRGHYGSHRAVHSSHMQVLSELGYPGALVWLGMFAYAAFACLRVRRRSRDPGLDERTSRFLWTTANGLLISMFGFLVGGSFLSLALNEITWLTFGMVGALEIVCGRVIADAHAEPVHEVPLAFRAVYALPAMRLRT